MAAVPQSALMALDAPPEVGQVIWCAAPALETTDGFVRARVVEVKAVSEIVVVPEGAEGGHVLNVPLRCCWACNEFPAEDVSQLMYPHEPGLLDNLRTRFTQGVMCIAQRSNPGLSTALFFSAAHALDESMCENALID